MVHRVALTGTTIEPLPYVAVMGLLVHDGAAWFAVLDEFFLKCIVTRSEGIGPVAGKSGASR
jgi:hypothetical protein